MGIASLQKLRSLDKQVDIHHVFFPQFYQFPYFKVLRKPIVFTSTTSMEPQISGNSRKNITYLSSSKKIIDQLLNSGVSHAQHVISGIEVERWRAEKAISSEEPFTLLMASAPHSRKQFESKGIYLLLDYLKDHHDVELNLLWRGVDGEYMRKLIDRKNLENRINFVNERVNVQEYFRQSHATILLCDEPGVLKNYPHSLIESICCARPVIISHLSELSRTVKNHKLGVVMEKSTINSLHDSISQLRSNYSAYQQNCLKLDKSVFDHKKYISTLKNIYQNSVSLGSNRSLT